MPDCIFCKIVAGEIPSQKKFENERFLAFLTIDPKGPQHTLLIPKAHYQWFTDLPDDVSDELFRIAKRLAKELKEETKSDYVRLGIVGKDVPHVHVHLVPQRLDARQSAGDQEL
ncbi:HIT family protein [Candidatus Kaiserbacteria bacterium]|nr:HIT family protein [Candidatus Kaiserbacteria bacterium]